MKKIYFFIVLYLILINIFPVISQSANANIEDNINIAPSIYFSSFDTKNNELRVKVEDIDGVEQKNIRFYINRKFSEWNLL